MIKYHIERLLFSMTLTQTEKGYPPPIEHVGIPAAIREEKGNDKISHRKIVIQYDTNTDRERISSTNRACWDTSSHKRGER